MPSTIRIGLLDTDPEVRFGRRLILSSQPNLEVVFESDGALPDLETIERSLIDVLIVNQTLSSGSGVGFYSNLRDLTGVKQAPTAIMTASYSQPPLLLEALQQGIYDVVPIEQGASDLLDGILGARSGTSPHSISSIRQLVLDLPTHRVVDVNFVGLVDDLPKTLASALKKLRTLWNSSDKAKQDKYELGVLNELVLQLPVANAVELLLTLNRSGLLDAE